MEDLSHRQLIPGPHFLSRAARFAELQHQRMIYVITPTYPRVNQIPEMTRLAQTLMLVPDVHWIVAEDNVEENIQLVEYLISTGLPYTYLKSPMPRQMNRWKMPPVGVSGRRAGLAWIRANVKTGVVYFADDDNTYDYRIFEEIRSTQAVSMFPAGFVTRLQLSTPILKNGKFAGWYDGWIADRKYPVDMATFAFSIELLLKLRIKLCSCKICSRSLSALVRSVPDHYLLL
ncbi:galactosylgalactosylxylosylprotein 3-beta-glucuronosyltransferase S-like [Macrobrachium nipponense]|uniref:galactosylgalactosylxylosylprotein 3-beta-glucuronosyltransferase S-like n=1 Tax=Macrobrachium nipponense TaxID=159736 RepID=UPI0030C7BC22